MVNAFKFLRHAVRMMATGLLVFGAVGCNVHEPWPDNPVKPTPDPPVVENVPVTLNFHFDTALPLYKEISYSRGTQTLHEMRYTVQVYAPSRASASEPHITWTFRCPVSDTPDVTTDVNLPDGEYELYAWADYVDAGTITDKYYDTSSWQTLKVADIKNHQGSTEYRDAFRGFTTKTIVNSSEVTPSPTATSTLQALPTAQDTVCMLKQPARLLSTVALSTRAASQIRAGRPKVSWYTPLRAIKRLAILMSTTASSL